MTREEILKDIMTGLKDDIIDVFDKSQKRVYIGIKPETLTRASEYIFKELGARFNIASGMDARKHMEILYHFTFEKINLVVSLRVKLAKDAPRIASLTPLFKGANWIEREINEMLGIEFTGHPDMKRLLLPEDWPKGVYPLRADYEEWDKGAIRDRGL